MREMKGNRPDPSSLVLVLPFLDVLPRELVPGLLHKI